MSNVGKLRRSGYSVFPIFRKSADPFQPEMGHMDFNQELDEVNTILNTSVQETEKAEQSIINDENSRKQYRMRKRKRRKEEINSNPEEEELFVDLTA